MPCLSRDKKGFALVVVILVMLLASFLASHLIMKVREELVITTKYRQRAVGRLLAEGGISLALFRLTDRPNPEYEELLDGAVFLKGYPYETVLPNGKIKYYAVDESGKINLNSTTTGLLEEFLKYQGLEPEEIRIILDSLLDWRDNDDLYRLDGAEKDYYEGLDNPYIPRNGKIEDPAEFFLIRGAEVLKDKFDPYEVFTVNTRVNQLDISSLSPPLLDFLTGGQKDLQTNYYEELRNGNGTISRGKFQEIIGNERFNPLKKYLAARPSRNTVLTITAYGYEGDFADVPQEEVIEADGQQLDAADEEKKETYYPGTKVRVMVEISNRDKGVKYLSWKEEHV